MTTPILLFSDHPAAHSGLARICRDLATQIDVYLDDDFRVATLGYGSPGSTRLRFPQYHWAQRDDFLPLELPQIWREFAQDEPGIVMTIGDIQRFLPLADGKFSQNREFSEWFDGMRRSKRIALWGYFPIDAHGVGGRLGPQLAHTLSHYDRVLVPSEWAKEIIRKTLPSLKVDAIPHGIDTDTFRPIENARDQFPTVVKPFLRWPQPGMNLPPTKNALSIGIVATNQSRKDYPLGIEVVAELKKTRPVFLWLHTDVLKREWSILELLSDFGLLQSSVITTGNLSDPAMAICYSAMDLTLGIGRGEGFGYGCPESVFCGTPCFAGSYGAHAEFMYAPTLIAPKQLRIEGPLNLMRPVYAVADWVEAITACFGRQHDPHDMNIDELAWINVWPRFEKWFREGIGK